MNGRNKFKKYKKIINFICKVLSIFSKKSLYKKFNKLNKGESTYKILLRYCIMKNLCSSIGDNVYIGEYVTIKNPDKLTIGDNVSIHKNCYIDALGEVWIGNDVSIATDTKIISFNHTWDDNNIPIKYNELSLKKIVIENDVWIGCSAIILAGVTISKRVIVGAGSVVTKNLNSKAIYAGTPAKLIKKMEGK